MLRFVTVTDDKLDLAEEVFHRVFSWMPELKPFTMMRDIDPKLDAAMKNQCRNEANIVYDDDALVGLEGIYIIPGNEDSGFLGWFGVVPEQRRNHYGAKVLKLHEDELKKRGYKFSRLWTDTQNNEKTHKFYQSQGYVGEVYNCPHDPLFKPGTLTIYSKSLGDYPVVPWNNREIGRPLCGNFGLPEQELAKFADYEERMADREHK